MAGLEKRLRALEEEDEKVGDTAALRRLTDEELHALIACGLRAQEDGFAGPTAKEAAAIKRFYELRRQALVEGWGKSENLSY